MVTHVKLPTDATVTAARVDGEPVTGGEFEALAARAVEVEGAAGPAAPAGQPVADPVQETRDLVDFACALLLPFVPDRYAARYGPTEREAIARTWVALAEKRGWDVAEVMGRWGPELAFAGAMVGPVLPIIVAEVRARKQAMQAPAPAPARDGRQQPGQVDRPASAA